MANELQYASPVTALLQGQQVAQQQQMQAQQQQANQFALQQQRQGAQRDDQFRNALQSYLTGGSDGLAAMYAADPQNAMQVQAFQTQQNQLAQQQQAIQAKQSYAQAQGVINSESPATYLRVLIPKAADAWAQQNGKSAEEMTDDEALSLAQQVATVAGAQAGIVPEYSAPAAAQADGKDVFFQVDKNSGKSRVLAGVTPKKPESPNSYEEFVRAQKDPDFAKFLKERKGKGLSVTTPDGTVIEIGGEGGGIGPGDLTAPIRGKLQESIVGATDELDRLNSIGGQFDPKFLNIPGKVAATGLKIKDLAGGYLGDLTPDQQKYLGDYSSFVAESAKNLSTILNRLSGAAISPAEAERLKKGIPNDEDSPVQFQAKYKAAVKDSSRAIMRANWALKNGIGVKSVEQLSKVMPLASIDQVYEQRANAIWQEIGGTADTKQQAVDQAKQEFGVAR